MLGTRDQTKLQWLTREGDSRAFSSKRAGMFSESGVLAAIPANFAI